MKEYHFEHFPFKLLIEHYDVYVEKTRYPYAFENSIIQYDPLTLRIEIDTTSPSEKDSRLLVKLRDDIESRESLHSLVNKARKMQDKFDEMEYNKKFVKDYLNDRLPRDILCELTLQSMRTKPVDSWYEECYVIDAPTYSRSHYDLLNTLKKIKCAYEWIPMKISNEEWNTWNVDTIYDKMTASKSVLSSLQSEKIDTLMLMYEDLKNLLVSSSKLT